MSSDRVALDRDGGVAKITLIRADRLNAIDEAMHIALNKALDDVDKKFEARALIITGSGRAFSAGQDLNERADAFERGNPPDLHASLAKFYNPLIRRLSESPYPVIAAVNGIAFGAGAGLALACDVVICDQSARFQFGFANVGLGLDCGASWTLPRRIGQSRALDLALTGRAVFAEEALNIGLVSRVVADADLAIKAQDLAVQMSEKSAAALQCIKAQLRNNPHLTLYQALDAEAISQHELGQTSNYRSAVLRFSGS